MNYEKHPTSASMPSRKSRKQHRNKVFVANKALHGSEAKKARKGS